MGNTTLRLAASIGLFVVGALLVLAVAAFLDRRVEHVPPLKRPSPWPGLVCVVLGAWGAVVEYSLNAAGVRSMICSALWGVFIVLGAIRLSQSVSWRPLLRPEAEMQGEEAAGK